MPFLLFFLFFFFDVEKEGLWKFGVFLILVANRFATRGFRCVVFCLLGVFDFTVQLGASRDFVFSAKLGERTSFCLVLLLLVLLLVLLLLLFGEKDE